MLRVKYVSNINSGASLVENKINEINFDSKFRLNEENKQTKNSFNTKRSFNADEYLSSLKMKLNDRDNFSTYIEQEKNYLRSSYESGYKTDLGKSVAMNKISGNNFYEEKINPIIKENVKQEIESKKDNDVIKPEIKNEVKKDDEWDF
jgi:hypothetical protein